MSFDARQLSSERLVQLNQELNREMDFRQEQMKDNSYMQAHVFHHEANETRKVVVREMERRGLR